VDATEDVEAAEDWATSEDLLSIYDTYGRDEAAATEATEATEEASVAEAREETESLIHAD
jgi:hypothetical protein